MQFTVKRLEIENFRSIQTKITLDIKPGLFSIEGINMDEPASKNGCGKSSLISALYWCLTGSALTNEVLADEVVNIKTGKDCRVTVYIDSNQGEIKIMRTRKDSELGNSLFLEIANQDLSCHKIADTQQRINQLIKIPFDLLHSTIMMTSDMKSAFSELSPQQRIQALESIRDYSVWDKVRDEANKDIKEYNKEIQDAKLNASSLEGSLNTHLQLLNKTQAELANLQNTFNLQSIENQIAMNQSEIKKLETEKDQLLLEKNAVANQTFPDTSELNKKLEDIMTEANSLKNTNRDSEYKKRDIEREIQIIDKWFKEDRCPTCGRLLERDEKTISQKTADKQKYEAQIIEINKAITETEQKINNKRQEWSKVSTELNGLDKVKKEAYDKERTINQKIDQIGITINRYTQDNIKLMATRDNHNKELEKLSQTIQEHTNKTQELSLNIKNLTVTIESLEKKRSLSDYFYKLLGGKGELRPYLLNKDVEYLNSCMQKYIARFFKNTDVTLRVNGAAIDILINSGGIQKNISSLSGGEKKRLNLAIQLALYDLIKSTSQVSFNLLWLDEIETQLDPLGCQQLIEIIEDKSDEVESTFWITNNSMVSENIPNKIICKKIMGKTEIFEQ